jgi:hypothetical protein
LEILDVVVESARRLASGDVHASSFASHSVIDKIRQAPVQTQTDEIKMSKTRYFFPSSRGKSAPKSFANLFHRHALEWIRLLMRGLFTSSLDWFVSECGVDKPSTRQPDWTAPRSLRLVFENDPDTRLASSSLSTTGLQLLSKWFTSLAWLIYIAGPACPTLHDIGREYGECAAWFWSLSKSLKVDNVAVENQPSYRQSILVAFWAVLEVSKETPNDALPFEWTHAFQRQGGLAAVIEWVMHVSLEDSSPENRMIARHVGLEIKQRLETLIGSPQ